MTTAKKTYQCDLCSATYDYAAGLGSHKYRAHGIRGNSTAAVYQAKKRTAAATAPAVNGTAKKLGRPLGSKNKTTQPRSTQLATAPTQSQSSNGHSPSPAAEWDSLGRTQTAAAIAYGRFIEMVNSVSREFNVPPLDVTRTLSRFVSGTH